jgi:5-(carboxyamino)imidazole ribonucleotide synthase
MQKRGAKIGILGGGQLARMLSLAAYKFGFETIIYEPQKDCPASIVSNQHIAANYDDKNALIDFAKMCDVISFEFENIPLDAAKLVEENAILYPSSKALALTQDRFVEKNFINSLGLKCAPFCEINSLEDLQSSIAQIGTPCILKTRRMGYDGKGQFLIKTPEMAAQAWEAMAQNPSVLEGFVKFEFETSIILTRAKNGEIAFYPNSQNIHENGILRTSIAPAPLNSSQIANAQEIGKKIADALEYVGTIAVELFVGDELIVNEIAPRVHNSGHWTIEGSATSQFENHIRAICGLTLGNTDLQAPRVEMQNLLGDEILNIPTLLQKPNTYPHDYGKHEIKAGRKMGHVTRLIK